LFSNDEVPGISKPANLYEKGETAMFSTNKINILRDDGTGVEASAPVILSASVATDIPAYHSDWFFKRIDAGYARRMNVFSHKDVFISFRDARLVVFWTKNPAPIMPKLHQLDDRQLGYFFHFTLNNYERERLEPGLPPLEKRIATFQELSRRIGKEKVLWRFDPMILTEQISPERLVEKVEGVAGQLAGCTEKLIFKFAKIERHRKVARRMTSEGWKYRNFSDDEVFFMANRLFEIGRRYGIEVKSCADNQDLSPYGIGHNRCVDPELIKRLFSHDPALMRFVDDCGKQKIQPHRQFCGCLPYTDIGEYNSCLHFCRYCYANLSDKLIKGVFESRLSRCGESMLK
jgi:DNA repair photolyase